MRDPIIEEIHRHREQLAKRFNYDIRAMTKYVREKYADRPNVVDLSKRARGTRAASVAEERGKYDGKE